MEQLTVSLAQKHLIHGQNLFFKYERCVRIDVGESFEFIRENFRQQNGDEVFTSFS